MKWITRAGAKVDRVACPWLILRFIDMEAEFVFVPKERVLEEAERLDAVPFDVEGVELGHHGPDCSFESIVKKYNLTDPALLELAKIVHGADTDDPNPVPQAAGLRAIAEGMARSVPDDREKLSLSFPIYDALYAWCEDLVAAR
ncbi:MAG TPA: chromate resistance protein ChrB domain-containing protein [Thermoplasmata archaeon]|nr:chromate resistance protein ChrB domain-containing protein [Thermoplasmata archaeon]